MSDRAGVTVHCMSDQWSLTVVRPMERCTSMRSHPTSPQSALERVDLVQLAAADVDEQAVRVRGRLHLESAQVGDGVRPGVTLVGVLKRDLAPGGGAVDDVEGDADDATLPGACERGDGGTGRGM